jgi:hypothetical protein
MPYDPPPIYLVACPDGRVERVRIGSPAQAVLLAAARRNLEGIYETKNRSYEVRQINEVAWGATLLLSDTSAKSPTQ